MSTPETNLSTPGTNLSSADAPVTVAPPVSGAARRSVLKTMVVLIRRELWEHRALWITPLIVGGLLVLTAFPIHIGNVGVRCSHRGARKARKPRRHVYARALGPECAPVSRHGDPGELLPHGLSVPGAQGPQHPVLEVPAGIGCEHGDIQAARGAGGRTPRRVSDGDGVRRAVPGRVGGAHCRRLASEHAVSAGTRSPGSRCRG